MNNPYAELISQERAKIQVLRERIAACEMRIQVLESLVPDELDDALTRTLVETRANKAIVSRSPGLEGGTVPSTEAAGVISSERPIPAVPERNQAEASTPDDAGDGVLQSPTRKLPTHTLRLLVFLAERPRTRDDMLAFMDSIGAPTNLSALSTFVYGYRRKFGFVEVDAGGRTYLTPRGVKYVKEHASETETPESVGADSGVFDNSASEADPTPEGTDR